ncbi:hypothetical protein AAU61_17875 [Desulfocarbo indianensis]|nr:hypothetical protein AAU61_17875 [Desulfocarbo indianensis]
MGDKRYPTVAQGYRILVVDDEWTVVELLSRFLTKKGYQVSTASDGREAWDLFQSHAFDLVLSDVRMPTLSGLQLLEEIKRANPRIPVILISGYGEVDIVVKALKAGAENFMAKPLRMDALERLVEQSLAISCLQPGASAQQTQVRQMTQIESRSRPEYISEIVYQISLSAVAVGFANHDLDNNVKLALVEALTNAMEHGNRWDEQKLVMVESKTDRENLEVFIQDQGPGFDYRKRTDPTKDENLLSERGRGIFLMRAIMDEVRFEDPGNAVTLVKRRANAPQDDDATK